MYRTGEEAFSMKLFWLRRNPWDIPTKLNSDSLNCFRLLKLINIFDSEEQLHVWSRQPSGQKGPRVWFWSTNIPHFESTPDLCALPTTYLPSLPKPILLPFLFLPIWDWCGLADDEADTIQRQESCGRRLSSKHHRNESSSHRTAAAASPPVAQLLSIKLLPYLFQPSRTGSRRKWSRHR